MASGLENNPSQITYSLLKTSPWLSRSQYSSKCLVHRFQEIIGQGKPQTTNQHFRQSLYWQATSFLVYV